MRAGAFGAASELLLDEWAESSTTSCSSGRCTSAAAHCSRPGRASAARPSVGARQAMEKSGRDGRATGIGSEAMRATGDRRAPEERACARRRRPPRRLRPHARRGRRGAGRVSRRDRISSKRLSSSATIDEASAVTARLRRLQGASSSHPWARGDGEARPSMIELAFGRYEEQARSSSLEEAAAGLGEPRPRIRPRSLAAQSRAGRDAALGSGAQRANAGTGCVAVRRDRLVRLGRRGTLGALARRCTQAERDAAS